MNKTACRLCMVVLAGLVTLGLINMGMAQQAAPAKDPSAPATKPADAKAPDVKTDPAFEAWAKKQSVPAAFVPLVEKAPELDGALDDTYKLAKPISFQFLAGGAGKPNAKTTAYMVSTADTLFIFLACESPDMSSLVANVRDHDGAVYNDDSIELFIDPANKREMDSYVHVAVNSLGTLYEAKGPADAEDTTWNPKIKAKTKVDKKSWTVEMAIPFDQLVSDVKKLNKAWAMNLNRMAYLVEGNEDTAWSSTGGTSSHVPTKFGALWLEAGKVDNAK
jgi:hypothetical protein